MNKRRARALLLLGSSLGSRRAALARALAGLAALEGTRLLSRSRVYETAPVGPSRRRYLNQAVAVETSLSPMGLLVECKRLEALAGRTPAARWSARTLDIDLAAYGKRRMKTPWLTVPHPRVLSRAFALAPLSDVDASYRAALRRLKPDARTVRIV